MFVEDRDTKIIFIYFQINFLQSVILITNLSDISKRVSLFVIKTKFTSGIGV